MDDPAGFDPSSGAGIPADIKTDRRARECYMAFRGILNRLKRSSRRRECGVV